MIKTYLPILITLIILFILYSNKPSAQNFTQFGGADPQQCDHVIVEVPKKVNCGSDKDCNVVFGNGLNKCVNGKCSCIEGKGQFCHKPSNYYLNPKDMTPQQIIKFKNKAKLEKMTIEDYVNWLSLFKYDLENLNPVHHTNYKRMLSGLPILEIPLENPIDDFLNDSTAQSQRVCMNVPNIDIDSPLNYQVNSQLNNSGKIDFRDRTERELNYARYFKHTPLTTKRIEPIPKITTKDWFYNNVNWLFADQTANYNESFTNPDRNRYLNIINDPNGIPKPFYTPNRLNNQTTSKFILPSNDFSAMPSQTNSDPADDAGDFPPIQFA